MANYKRKFSKIYDKNVDRIYRFVFLKVGSKELAEDLTAQVFSNGWKKFSLSQKSGEQIKNVGAYLYQIARSEIAGYYRREKKYQIISTDSVPIIDSNIGLEQNEQLKTDIELIRKHLAGLKSDYQNVLIMRYVNEMPLKTIAEAVGKKQGAVRVLIHRALKELKKQIEQAGLEV